MKHYKNIKIAVFSPGILRALYSEGAYWASTRENLSSGFAKNTGADQPAHQRSLISAFVISYVNLLQVKFQFSS